MIFLARHCETTWNLAGRYQGRLESALSGFGVRQGFALADYFARRATRGDSIPALAISSPLLRCTATARFVTDRLALPLATDERLIEIDHGRWQGRYRDELARDDPERYRIWREEPAHVAFEDGETLLDVRARWRAFAETALAGEERDVLIVTHDAVVRCALLDVTGRRLQEFWRPKVENAGFARLERDGRKLRVVEECVVSHLTGVRASLAGQAL
jgi:broad specificity phosphatase PhoE